MTLTPEQRAMLEWIVEVGRMPVWPFEMPLYSAALLEMGLVERTQHQTQFGRWEHWKLTPAGALALRESV